ncbi:MAG: type II secretion system protein [Pirellulales bacterium]
MRRTTSSNRAGFTLAELLVVIAIISTLLALLVPAVRLAISSARKAAIKTEIDMLHMAVMNYKNEYGGLPPCVGYTNALSERPVRHLRRLFPRCTTVAINMDDPRYPLDQFRGEYSPKVTELNPANSLLFWLSGYTSDPEKPLIPAPSRKSMYDYDQLRAKNYVYKAPYSLDTAYLFFDSGSYETLDGTTRTIQNPFTNQSEPVTFEIPKHPKTGEFLEPGRFIILAAGLDGEFYTADDLSNAWTGTWESFKSQVASQ